MNTEILAVHGPTITRGQQSSLKVPTPSYLHLYEVPAELFYLARCSGRAWFLHRGAPTRATPAACLGRRHIKIRSPRRGTSFLEFQCHFGAL